MAKPSHPKRKVIKKNEYYPKGLTEGEVWEYYDGIKDKIFPYLQGKVIFVVLKTKLKNVYMRHPFGKKKDLIVLNSLADFDKFNTGRILEFHITAGKKEEMIVFDIDPGKGVSWKNLRLTVKRIYNDLKKMKMKDVRVFYTGKKGFHLWCYLNKKEKIDDLREFWQSKLKSAYEGDNLIDVDLVKAKNSRINIDLSPLAFNSGHISPFSLRSETGLVCQEVDIDNIMKIEKEAFKQAIN